MSLTKEQKRELGRLNEQLKKIERLAANDNIDLDVFMTDYKDNGFAFYQTEKININSNAEKRKGVFEKSGKEKHHPKPKAL